MSESDTTSENCNNCIEHTEKIINMDYDTIVISGGALHGLSILGALQYIQENYYAKHVKNYYGTSVGAMICYLLAIGYTPTEIMVYICTHQIIEKMRDLNVAGVLNGAGLISYNSIQEHLERMTIEKIGKYITLGDVKRLYDINLTMTTYNVTKGCVEYLSSEKTPEIPCIVALRMTSNIPLIFEHFKYMNCYYIDGGVANNFPIDEACKHGGKILGVYLTYNSFKIKDVRDVGLMSYLIKMFKFILSTSTNLKIEQASHTCSLIKLDSKGEGFNFDINSREKLDMFSVGYNTAKLYFED